LLDQSLMKGGDIMVFKECTFVKSAMFINKDSEGNKTEVPAFYHRCTFIGITNLPAIWRCEECTVMDEEIGEFNWGFTLN